MTTLLKFWKLWPILALIMLLVGCVGPLKRYTKSQAKVDKAKVALQSNQAEQQSSGRDYVYAADHALAQDPKPSRESSVASDMTHRALLALGLPEAETAARLRQMITDLTSTNEALVARGEKELAEKDAVLARLQSERHELDDKLGQAEAKLRAVSQENAALASKWVRLRRICNWLIAGAVFLVLAMVAMKVLPIFFPELSVARSTLLRVVSAVQSVREKFADQSPEQATILDQTLSQVTDQKHRWEIKKLKRQLGKV